MLFYTCMLSGKKSAGPLLGIKPLTVQAHLRQGNLSLRLLRCCRCKEAYNFFSSRSSQIFSGIRWADNGPSSAFHVRRSRGQSAHQLCGRLESNARMAFSAGQPDLSAFYGGAILHLIQDAAVPYHSPLALTFKGDLYEKDCRPTFVRLTGKRRRIDLPLRPLDASSCLQEAGDTLQRLRILCRQENPQKQHRAIVRGCMEQTELLGARYLLHLYQQLQQMAPQQQDSAEDISGIIQEAEDERDNRLAQQQLDSGRQEAKDPAEGSLQNESIPGGSAPCMDAEGIIREAEDERDNRLTQQQLDSGRQEVKDPTESQPQQEPLPAAPEAPAAIPGIIQPPDGKGGTPPARPGEENPEKNQG